MRTVRLPLAASLAAASATALLLVACGGGTQAAAPPAATPAGAAAATDPAAAAGAAAPSAAPSSSPPSTTSLTLADGGDVQGTKLQQSTTNAASGAAVNNGPARGPHPSEPGRSVKDIQVIIQSHRDDARACYDAAQTQHPDATMKGNLDVKWTIDPTGKVTAISVDDAKSDIHDPGVAKCVMAVVQGLSFAVSAKGFETYAHYPFNFQPKYVRPAPTPPPQGQP
jgi:hypothetical protein